MYKPLCTIIRSYREKSRLSQSELAAKVGVSTQQICKYECGKNEPKFQTLRAVKQILHIPDDEFFPERA
jgi:transcriptional regulator with XRE-family HTH domain